MRLKLPVSLRVQPRFQPPRTKRDGTLRANPAHPRQEQLAGKGEASLNPIGQAASLPGNVHAFLSPMCFQVWPSIRRACAFLRRESVTIQARPSRESAHCSKPASAARDTPSTESPRTLRWPRFRARRSLEHRPLKPLLAFSSSSPSTCFSSRENWEVRNYARKLNQSPASFLIGKVLSPCKEVHCVPAFIASVVFPLAAIIVD